MKHIFYKFIIALFFCVAFGFLSIDSIMAEPHCMFPCYWDLEWQDCICDEWTCFPAETKVEMGDGSTKNIEDIKIQDQVMSQDESGNKTVSTVTKLDQPVRDHMCQINYTDGERLRLTDEHPLMTQNGWKSINPGNSAKDVPSLPVTQLGKGDRVVKSDGSSAEVDYFGCWSEKIQTYNLILSGNNRTYFADGYLAHNKEGGISCPDGTHPILSNPPVYLQTCPVKCHEECTSGGDCWDVCVTLPCKYCMYPSACAGMGGCSVPYDYSCNAGQAYCQVCSCTPIAVPTPTPTPTPAPTPTPTPTPVSSCTVSLTPASSSIQIGGTTIFTSSVSTSNGTVSNVTFSSSNSSVSSVSPSSDSTSPYRTTATGVSGGSATITTRVYMGGVEKCSDTSTVSVAQPSCTVSLVPTSSSLQIGGSSAFTASVTPVGGTVSNVTFSSSASSIASVSPASDSSSPYITTATGVSGGSATITVRAYIAGVQRCSDTSTVSVAQPSCTLSLLPSSDTIDQSESTTFSASVIPTGGTISRVDFSSSNSSIASVNPASDTTPVYQTSATGNAEGSAVVTARGFISGIERCSDTSNLTVNAVPDDPWWQVRDGDVTSGGSISSQVVSGDVFIQDGAGGYPGIPVYADSLDTNSNPVSSKEWKANTGTSLPKLFDYSYFSNLVPSDVVFLDPATTALDSGGTMYHGYYWYRASSGYSINSNLNLGNRKVILFVTGGNLNINSRINLNDGSGFFMAIVDDDISVASTVTGAPSLEGLYVSDGSFSTGSGSSQLHLRGSVAAYSGFNLQRDLTDDINPAEYFEYAPDQLLLFPYKLGTRRTRWNEIAS